MKICSGGDNANGHQCKEKMGSSEKKVNKNTYVLEIAFAEYFSRLLSNIQSEQSRVPGSGQPASKY